MKYPFASDLIAQVGAELELVIELEPEFGFVGEIIFPDGNRHLFKNTNFNVNPAGSVEIARDKAYTSYFLNKYGFNVPIGKTFFSDELNKNIPTTKQRGIPAALNFAEKIGYPVFAKPNNLSQGTLVTKAINASELEMVAQEILTKVNVMLVEKACVGRDYRVVILGNEVISAYERIPLKVIGNGKSSIDELLLSSKDRLTDHGRPNAEIDLLDFRIDMQLSRLALSRNSILPNEQTIQLLDNANLSTGGTSIDVTESIHSSFVEQAISATKKLGLTLSGVDFICEDICLPTEHQQWVILEINAAPGLDNYASLGQQQSARVRELYKKILIHLSHCSSASFT